MAKYCKTLMKKACLDCWVNRGAQLDAAALGGMEPLTLTGIFHTAKRRVRARGLQEPSEVLAGRVPSRGAVSALPSECEYAG